MKAAVLAFLALTALLFLFQVKEDSKKSNSIGKETLLSPAKPLSSPKTAEVLSVDGTVKASMKSQERLDGGTDYSFFVSGAQAKDSILIYSKTAQKGSMDLPKNTWAPDNKYLFILDAENGSRYLVFKANGQVFANGNKFIDASSLFRDKESGFSLSEITGWDGIGLMHVKASGGTNFWFDIDSQNFIALAR